MANNAADRNASKHDDFSSPAAMAIRASAGGGEPAKGGYRPACIGGWSVHYGVGMEGHVDCGRAGSITDFRREFSGLRGDQYATVTSPGWTTDRSQAGSDLGGGDYTPGAGSVLLGRVTRGNSDRDFAGAARMVGGAAGALEAGVTPGLSPDPARSAHYASVPTVGLGMPVSASVSMKVRRF